MSSSQHRPTPCLPPSPPTTLLSLQHPPTSGLFSVPSHSIATSTIQPQHSYLHYSPLTYLSVAPTTGGHPPSVFFIERVFSPQHPHAARTPSAAVRNMVIATVLTALQHPPSATKSVIVPVLPTQQGCPSTPSSHYTNKNAATNAASRSVLH